MLRALLISIASDPRKSARAAEAVRIAAGIGAWNKVQVHLSLEGEAVRCLDEFADEFENGELFPRYLPTIATHGGRILVESGNPVLDSVQTALPLERVSQEELRRIAAQVDHVMRF